LNEMEEKALKEEKDKHFYVPKDKNGNLKMPRCTCPERTDGPDLADWEKIHGCVSFHIDQMDVDGPKIRSE